MGASDGCPWDEETCAYALRGHLDVLKWARQNGCEWDEETCRAAALGGHLEVLKWARQNGCPWDGRTCWAAAYGGHLEVLRWLRQNGCPWDEVTCSSAALGGHWRCCSGRVRRVRLGRGDLLGAAEEAAWRCWWASERVPVEREDRGGGVWRPPGGVAVGASERVPVEREDVLVRGGGGHLEVLKWAHENGCRGTGRAGPRKRVHLEVLKWARDNGCPRNKWTWDHANSRCRPYLIEHGCPGSHLLDDARS